MIILSKGTTHKLQLTTDASADVRGSVSSVSKTGTGPASYSFAGNGTPLAAVASATTVDIIAGASSTEVSVRHLSLYNNHASTSVTVTVTEVDGTSTTQHQKLVLAPGESLKMDAAGVWTHYDANGGPYVGTGPMATQAEMEAASSTTKVVNPNNMKWHPGMCKGWGLLSISGTVTAGLNVSAPTDNGVGDITVNWTTAFSSSSYQCVVSVEMTATTYGVANSREAHIRFGGQAAGSLRCDCIDNTVTTNVIKDPTVWHVAAHGDQ